MKSHSTLICIVLFTVCFLFTNSALALRISNGETGYEIQFHSSSFHGFILNNEREDIWNRFYSLETDNDYKLVVIPSNNNSDSYVASTFPPYPRDSLNLVSPESVFASSSTPMHNIYYDNTLMILFGSEIKSGYELQVKTGKQPGLHSITLEVQNNNGKVISFSFPINLVSTESLEAEMILLKLKAQPKSAISPLKLLNSNWVIFPEKLKTETERSSPYSIVGGLTGFGATMYWYANYYQQKSLADVMVIPIIGLGAGFLGNRIGSVIDNNIDNNENICWIKIASDARSAVYLYNNMICLTAPMPAFREPNDLNAISTIPPGSYRHVIEKKRINGLDWYKVKLDDAPIF